MPTLRTIDLTAGPDLAAAVADAVEALRAGEAVVLPTETVYGIAVTAADQAGLDRLAEARGGAEPSGPPALHLPGLERLEQALPDLPGSHRRLIHRLAPGPAAFLIPVDEQASQRFHTGVGAAPGLLEKNSEVLLRAPAHEVTQRVLEEVGRPVVMAAAAPEGRSAPVRGEDAIGALTEAGLDKRIALLLEDGPTRLGRPSTVIRLTRDGGVSIVREGAYEQRYVFKQLGRSILFVCSGNTCRSPLAATIAADLLGSRPGGGDVSVASAGTSAAEGQPITPEAAQALENMGIEPRPHSSRLLSRELVNQADAVYCMTADQAAAVASLAPEAREHVHLLDPQGGDISDPMGGSQQVYDQTGRRLRELIARRLEELDA